MARDSGPGHYGMARVDYCHYGIARVGYCHYGMVRDNGPLSLRHGA